MKAVGGDGDKIPPTYIDIWEFSEENNEIQMLQKVTYCTQRGLGVENVFKKIENKYWIVIVSKNNNLGFTKYLQFSNE